MFANDRLKKKKKRKLFDLVIKCKVYNNDNFSGFLKTKLQNKALS